MKIKKVAANLENYGSCELNCDRINGCLELIEEASCSYIRIDCECVFHPYDYARVFKSCSSLVVTVEEKIEKILAQRIKSPFWVGPAFAGSTTQIPDKTQALLVKREEDCAFVYGIANENYQVTMRRGENENEFDICINTIAPGITKICGIAAIISYDKNPYTAIENGFHFVQAKKLIQTPLKCSKTYPEALNYLGWCTWNAFYHDVSQQGIIDKMEEFKKKNIPVKWVLIDDGWSEVYEDMTLKSIFENKEKFPEGLKHTIMLLKEKYGIKYVGVWHAATGYWKGTAFKNEKTVSSASGIELPGGYEFFSEWHSYLKEQGVDFIKVDSQGNIPEFMQYNRNSLKTITNIQKELDKSAQENFCFMINCMGMVNINMQNRPSSVICRNSDDFFPLEKESLQNHVTQNLYNALFNDHLFFCDFDMWWSKHFEATQNAVLRAISGGPFYLSDKVGDSEADIIAKFVDKDGKITRCDHAAMPTTDCVFGYDKILKAFNTVGKKGVVAVFAFEEGGSTFLSAADFGGNGVYNVKESLSGERFVLNSEEKREVKLDAHSVKLFEFTQA